MQSDQILTITKLKSMEQEEATHHIKENHDSLILTCIFVAIYFTVAQLAVSCRCDLNNVVQQIVCSIKMGDHKLLGILLSDDIAAN